MGGRNIVPFLLFSTSPLHRSSDSQRASVEAINKIGQEMGIRTIAEFVENDAIKEELKKINADFVQGFGIEHPVPINDANVAGRDEPQLLLAARG
jgi:EAL domain-containing protein (putative c-di-GMP-specific phosphodiesterase class I)